MTVLEQLIASLRQAATYNRHDLAAPRVVLWTDGDRLWTNAVQALTAAIPELLVLGPSEGDTQHGSSTWVRYQLGRSARRETPLIYLPGLSRHAFRGVAGFPESARHLFALQYQGQFWTQTNGKDWTPFAFLSSKDGGIGLDIARDGATLEAIADQLDHVLQAPVESLQGRRIEAAHLHELATSDSVRFLLQWIGAPDTVRRDRKAGEWKGFAGICKQKFGFDPDEDGVLTAVEKLAAGGDVWDDVWKRYCEAPKSFAGVRKALNLVQPHDLFDSNNDRIPANNRKDEDSLRKELASLAQMQKSAALETLSRSCSNHQRRADSLWAEIGEAPLAIAAFHLSGLVEAIRVGAPGHDWPALADSYTKSGWRADTAVWKAFAAVREPQDVKAVTAAIRAVYLPWLEESNSRVDGLVSSYPNAKPGACRNLAPSPGTIVVFVDGLRCDLGIELQRRLKDAELSVTFETSWSALPTVTATAKPAWHPLAGRLKGDVLSDAFEPQQGENGRALKSPDFRKALDEIGWAWVDPGATGDPSGAGWTETGNFDHYGHDQGARLAWRIEEELRGVVLRITELLKSGWKTAIVITDHGWLLAPGGLPKVDFPGHLTVTKWRRCAIPHGDAQHGFPQVSWFWGPEHAIVLAPGISVFIDGTEYAHGGLSVQEALTPCLTVTAAAGPLRGVVRVESIKWIGLRLQVHVSGASEDTLLDIRTKPADKSSSVLTEQRAKAPDGTGKASLVVDRDDLIGHAAVLVVVQGGQVTFKKAVTIGEN